MFNKLRIFLLLSLLFVSHPKTYALVAVVEDCSNGVDDDGDGLVDCNDDDCFSDPACAVLGEICDNGIDDDGDGFVDCADSACDFDSACTSSTASGLIVNEYSNGDSGNKEYMEFLVIGDPCTTVDIRNWIFDDNNGVDDATCEGFSIEDCGAGIAPGHARFRNTTRWSAVPVGSLILVYNDADKNLSITLADDPSDANGDLVYVLPISDSGIEGTGTLPDSPKKCGEADYTPGICSYSPVSYSSPVSWSRISLNNTQDACQTRMPDGSYFHGFSYGTSNMTGGPDALNFNTTGTGKVFYLNCGHHTFITDYSYNDVAGYETPGAPNNAQNDSLVNYYRGTYGCGYQPLCVTLLSSKIFNLKGKSKKGENELSWRVDDQIGVNEYSIERSSDKISFESIGTVKAYQTNRYLFIDDNPKETNYYRVTVKLENGSHKSNTIVLKNSSTNTFGVNNLIPNPANNSFSFDFELKDRGAEIEFAVYNILGEIVQKRTLNASQNVRVESSNLESGMYYLVFSSSSEHLSMKMLIQH